MLTDWPLDSYAGFTYLPTLTVSANGKKDRSKVPPNVSFLCNQYQNSRNVINTM